MQTSVADIYQIQRDQRSYACKLEVRTVTEATKPAVGLDAEGAAVRLLQMALDANAYHRRRKAYYRRWASGTWGLSLVLSATSIIILGVQDLSLWASIGFSLVPVAALLNGVEPYFNWRSRWVMSEESQERFYRLEEDIRQKMAITPKGQIAMADIDAFYDRYTAAWEDFSRQWISNRRHGQQGQNVSQV
jgi:hypothetical protein